MSSSQLREWRGGCPPLAVLEAFSMGRLPIESFDAVANHTSSCEVCEVALQSLDDRTDSLIESLGRHLSPVSTAGLAPRRPPRADTLEGTRLGHYELLDRLGAGGMGVVYKAMQDRPRRLVAVKVAHRWRWLGDEALARLSTEVEAVGRLQHPNIIPIYESGDQDGRPYFAMEYAPGGSLASQLRRGPLAEREAAELVRDMALAVAAMHRMGLIHRDLKPANVLLDKDGVPKLADFGLAKFLDTTDLPAYQTGTGVVLGTASYMAPEQARGDAEAVGPPVDIYGLGAILFEALTGHPPFDGENREAILRQVETTPAPPPTEITTEPISRVLEAICLKCLEKLPERRYHSAQALAHDLDCWLNGQPTLARPPGWVARNRKQLSFALAGLIALAFLSGGFKLAVQRNPELQWTLLQPKLAQQQSVNLFAENDGHFYYKIRRGDDSTKVQVAEDGTLTVHTWTNCLIELVRTPATPRYRFRVDIRHERSDIIGTVGVYVAHQDFPLGPIPNSHLVHVVYNDVVSAGRVANQPSLGPVGIVRSKMSEQNKAQLRVEQWGLDWNHTPWGGIVALDSGPPFDPQGKVQDRWRSLEMVVTPDEVRSRWDGQPVGVLSAHVLTDTINDLRTKRLAKNQGGPHPPPEMQSFDPMGGIGLLLTRGSASFRLARLEPIPDAPRKE